MREEIARDLDVRPSSVALWFGALTGPLAFLIAQLIKYASVQFICRNGMTWILWLTALVALAATVVAGLNAARFVGAEEGRVKFMAIGAVAISVMCVLAIGALCIPDFFISPCD
jgi:hypothetical protein